MQTKTNLLSCYNAEGLIEAGCDEAGRGCLAGSVFAAAVILPDGYASNQLDDSKRLTARQRYALREVIMRDAVAWAVGEVTAKEIDEMNILNASIEAMHRALSVLAVQPRFIIVDGNRFKPYGDIPYQTIVKGDSKYQSIAAASILARPFVTMPCAALAISIRLTDGSGISAIQPQLTVKPSVVVVRRLSIA